MVRLVENQQAAALAVTPATPASDPRSLDPSAVCVTRETCYGSSTG